VAKAGTMGEISLTAGDLGAEILLVEVKLPS
jgi:hypothetical protein